MSARPNIVVVTFHDLGRHLTPYGVDTVRTPAFERLAARGATFETAAPRRCIHPSSCTT